MPPGQPKTELDEHLKRLYASPYYHGLRSRAHVEETLKERGEYLIRSPKGKKNEVILSLCMGTTTANPKFLHLPLTFNVDTKSWDLHLLYRKPGGKGLKSNRSIVEEDAPPAGGAPKGISASNRKQASSFRTIDDFINEHKKRPMRGVILTKFARRPKWLINYNQLKWNKRDFLGKGHFCQVVKGKLTRKPITLVAIKMLHEEENDQPTDDDQRDEGRDSMFREAQIMSKCRHKHITMFFGVQCDVAPIMIVMEYCPGGSLDVHLQHEKEAITQGERAVYCFEAARGMRYLHFNNIIHRDLAARNCLISDRGTIKISDFGMSRVVEQQQSGASIADIRNIPLRWMAPETLSRTPAFSNKSDIWAYGILVYEIFNLGIKPWAEEEDQKKIAHWIKHGPMPDIPERATPSMKGLIHRCWHESAAERPEFREIIKEILKMQKTHPQLKFPKSSSDFTLNRLPGVSREDAGSISTEEATAEKSVMNIYDEAKTPTYGTSEETTTVSRDSKGSRETTRDSAEDLTKGIRATKKQRKSQHDGRK